jgi:hypothetical protein
VGSAALEGEVDQKRFSLSGRQAGQVTPRFCSHDCRHPARLRSPPSQPWHLEDEEAGEDRDQAEKDALPRKSLAGYPCRTGRIDEIGGMPETRREESRSWGHSVRQHEWRHGSCGLGVPVLLGPLGSLAGAHLCLDNAGRLGPGEEGRRNGSLLGAPT